RAPRARPARCVRVQVRRRPRRQGRNAHGVGQPPRRAAPRRRALRPRVAGPLGARGAGGSRPLTHPPARFWHPDETPLVDATDSPITRRMPPLVARFGVLRLAIVGLALLAMSAGASAMLVTGGRTSRSARHVISLDRAPA